MGCDIHAAIEFKNGTGKWEALLSVNPDFGRWEDEPEKTARLYLDRDYDMFAILANVRNGHGFAGCDTGDGFVSMSDCRGIPVDASPEAMAALSDEHSATWVTLSEILSYDWTRRAKHRGWVNAVGFEQWDRMKQWRPAPMFYCGGVSGPSVQHISEVEMRRRVKEVIGGKQGEEHSAAVEQLRIRYGSTYCLIEWETSYAESGKQIWMKVLPKMLNLGAKYGNDNVRLVMDFDS